MSRPTTRNSSLLMLSVSTPPRSWYSRFVTSIVRPPASWNALRTADEHAVQRQAALAQQRRKQLDLILLLESADRRDLSDASSRLQRRLDVALVQQAKLAQVADALPVEQRILKDPAHAARVRADRDVRVGRQLRSDGIEAIGHDTAARPPGGRGSSRIT